MNTKSVVSKLQLVVFLSVFNTFAIMAMVGQAYSGEFVKAFASASGKVTLAGNTEPSMISVEGIVLDR